MPQRHLPFFPPGVTDITPEFAFRKEDGQVTYFNGHMPVFIHEEGDKATFRRGGGGLVRRWSGLLARLPA
jgi:hypothetical protein